MIPLGYANATAAVSEEHRGWAIGIVSTGATVFLALGPVVGGVLVEVVGWRWIFLINLPVVAAIVTIGLLRIPESRSSLAVSRCSFMAESRAPNPPPLDVPGLVLLTAGLAAIVAGLLHMQRWATPVGAGVLALGASALGAFVWVERHSPHPLLPLDLLRKPRVISSMAALVARVLANACIALSIADFCCWGR